MAKNIEKIKAIFFGQGLGREREIISLIGSNYDRGGRRIGVEEHFFEK